MGHRLSKIVTKTGDNGTTGLGDGTRVKKNDIHIEAIGTLDELNSSIGLLRSELLPNTNPDIAPALAHIQQTLFNLGGELCLPNTQLITNDNVNDLETTLTKLNEQLPPLKDFILPNGNKATTSCHLARAICRRTERRLVSLNEVDQMNPASLAYINRLSDLLFVIARTLAREADQQEVLWQHEKVKKP